MPTDVLQALAALEALDPPARSDREMARLLALAVIRLRQSIDRDGWLKPPYNPDIQRFLDLSAGRNARERGGA